MALSLIIGLVGLLVFGALFFAVGLSGGCMKRALAIVFLSLAILSGAWVAQDILLLLGSF